MAPAGVPGAGAGRRCGYVTGGDPRSVAIPAAPEQVRAARAFVAGALGESCAQANVALLLASELVTNSVEHSGSAVAGGVVTVTVAARDGLSGSRSPTAEGTGS